jgi:hypothetical protein
MFGRYGFNVVARVSSKTHAHEQEAILMGDEVARWLPYFM